MGVVKLRMLVVVMVVCAVSASALPVLTIDEFSGVFGSIDVAGDGGSFTLQGGALTVTAPDSVFDLTVAPVTVDLAGYDSLAGGAISILGGAISIENNVSGTAAHYEVHDPTLTQVLNTPIGIGYIAFANWTLISSDLTTGLAEPIEVPDTLQAAISINGLTVTTDGQDGTASAPFPASASITAFTPEPSVLSLVAVAGLLLLGRGKR